MEVIFSCENCDKLYPNKQELFKHKNVCVTKNDKKIYTCRKCNKEYGYKQSRWLHEKNVK